MYALVNLLSRSRGRPNNEKPRSRYCTVKANYRQKQSRGLSATAELLVKLTVGAAQDRQTDRQTDGVGVTRGPNAALGS